MTLCPNDSNPATHKFQKPQTRQNFFGYFIVVHNIGKTQVPLVIQRVRDEMDELKRTIPRAEWKNSGAWNYWLVTLTFNILFCFMHFLNYEYNPQLYAATVFGINLPWTLSCVRNFIVVADTHWERRFVIAYEIIVRQPFFRNRESPPLAPFFLLFRTFWIIGLTNERLSPSYICSKCLYSYSTFHILLSDSFVQKKNKIK